LKKFLVSFWVPKARAKNLHFPQRQRLFRNTSAFEGTVLEERRLFSSDDLVVVDVIRNQFFGDLNVVSKITSLLCSRFLVSSRNAPPYVTTLKTAA